MKTAIQFSTLRRLYGDGGLVKFKAAGRIEQDTVEIEVEEARELHKELAGDDSHGLTESRPTGLGDLVHKVAGPIGKAIHWPCNERDADGNPTTELRPGSPCAHARALLNKIPIGNGIQQEQERPKAKG